MLQRAADGGAQRAGGTAKRAKSTKDSPTAAYSEQEKSREERGRGGEMPALAIK